VAGRTPEPAGFDAELTRAQEELAARDGFAVDALVARAATDVVDEHREDPHDVPVQRSVPEIELAPTPEEHEHEGGRRHRPRHRQEVDLTEPVDRPDPVRAALDAAGSAVPPQRRPAPRETEPRFRIAEPQPGVEQLKSWLRT
jgi:hypothetical protein